MTAAARAQLNRASYAEARPDAALELYAGASALAWAPAPSDPAQRSVALELASFVPQAVELDIGAQHRQIEVPAGVSTYHTGALSVPATITIRPATAPVALRWASLAAVGAPAALAPSEPVALLGVRATPQANGAQVALQTSDAGAQLLRYAIEVYADLPGYRDAPGHYAWALFPAPPAGAHQIELDLRAPRFTLDGREVPLQTGELRDGAYFASLWVYQGEQVRGELPFLRFERRAGRIEHVAPIDVNAAFVPIAVPRQAADARFGDAFRLRGFEIDRTAAHPGAALRASLLWQAEQPQTGQYAVFAQLLDTNNRKIAQWDGLAGGVWWQELGWRAGQQIWQDIPLRIAADAPPGRYQLIVGIYDPATGARVRLADGADSLLLGQVDVGP